MKLRWEKFCPSLLGSGGLTCDTMAVCPGKPYHLEFVDLVRFNSQGKIAQMKEFKDTGHVQNHIEEHEKNEDKK